MEEADNGAAPEAGEPPTKGHDVAIAHGGNNDFDMENGDDIVVYADEHQTSALGDGIEHIVLERCRQVRDRNTVKHKAVPRLRDQAPNTVHAVAYA